MKLLTSILAISLLAGCATNGTNPITTSAPTVDQLVSQFCPAVQAINEEILVLPGVDPKVVSAISSAKPIVSAVCSNGAKITASNLQNLLVSGLPLLETVIASSAISATPAGQALAIALPIAELIIPQIIATLPK